MKIYARNLIKTYLRLCFAVHNADQHCLMPLAGEDNGTLHGDFWRVCVWVGKIKKLVNMVSKQRARKKSMAQRFRVARCEIIMLRNEVRGGKVTPTK